jgi:hypothetical protein
MQRCSFPMGPISMAMAIGGGLLLVPEMAAAKEDALMVGITLSYSIGVRPAFGIGLDLRYSHYIAASLDPRSEELFKYYDYALTGAFAQAAYLQGGAFRFALGMHGGYRPSREIINVDGEVGITYRTQSNDKQVPSGVGLHFGFVPAFSLLLAEAGLSIRGSIGLTKNMGNELILGVEGRGPGPCYFFISCYHASGRPLRVDESAPAQTAPLMLEKPIQDSRPRTARKEIDDVARACLAAHWLRETSAECASIPAFLALARDLALVDASSSLVARARRAAKEEANHTRLCAALASEYAGYDVAALIPGIPKQLATNREGLLKRLAVESFWDGCVGEGAAAAQARRMAAHATDARTRETLSIIARDEQTHADLAVDILRFCLSTGGKNIRDALVSSIETRRMTEENGLSDENAAHESADEDELRRLGPANVSMQRLAREEALGSSLRLVA